MSLLAAGYVNLMRSVPLVLMIFWFYFLVPYIGQWITGAPRPIQVGAFVSSLVTFTLFEAAYFCEIMRAGIQSIPRGQVARRNDADARPTVQTEHPARKVIEQFKAEQRDRLIGLCAASGIAEPDLLADELFLLLEGARVSTQSFGPNGPASRLVRRLQNRIAIR